MFSFFRGTANLVRLVQPYIQFSCGAKVEVGFSIRNLWQYYSSTNSLGWTILDRLMLGVSLAQATPSNPVPFPTTTPGSTVTDNGVESGTRALENARDAGDLAASGLDRIWTELISPDSPFYSGLIHGLTPLVLIGFICWAGMWLYEIIQQGFSRIPLHQVIWTLIVILFLHGDGLLLASSTVVM